MTLFFFKNRKKTRYNQKFKQENQNDRHWILNLIIGDGLMIDINQRHCHSGQIWTSNKIWPLVRPLVSFFIICDDKPKYEFCGNLVAYLTWKLAFAINGLKIWDLT